MPIQWAVGAMFLIYMVSTWFTSSLLKLTGSDLWIFRGALSALGITSYAIFYWWLNKRQAAKAAQQSQQAGGGGAAPEAVDEVGLLVREAEKRLTASRLSEEVKLGRLPVFLLVG